MDLEGVPAAARLVDRLHLREIARCSHHYDKHFALDPIERPKADLVISERQVSVMPFDQQLHATTDADAWMRYPHLRWLYDRLQLSLALGYECGPAGTLPPRPGIWFVKPIVNLNGMGVGAHVRHYDGSDAFPVPPGSFWMPYFTGRHFSIDLERVASGWRFGLTVECIYRDDRPYEWKRMADGPPLPAMPSIHAIDVPHLNFELIGSRVIEVHLRRNHDFDPMPDAISALPVWDGDTVPADMIADPEDADGFLVPKRLGFVYRR